MLIEARIENHRSIREEQVLTMEAAALGDPDDSRAREVEGHKQRLLPATALYGANASGKSNFLSGLSFMRGAVVDSQRQWSPQEGIRAREPFAWGPQREEPTLCEVVFLIDGVRYQYGFAANDERFTEEWLYAWPRGRKQTWFERDGEGLTFGEKLLGENRVIREVLRPNALFLSAATQLNHEQLSPIFRWFWRLRLLLRDREALISHWRSPGQIERIRAIREKIVDFLRIADLGIEDLKLEESQNASQLRRFWPPVAGEEVFIRHRAAVEAWLPLSQESRGTRTLFEMAPEILDAQMRGSVLVIDELEASLHPLLARRIIELFNDPETNPMHAQLIFATHDTHLLGGLAGEIPLRRDQVWLTEKDSEGATVLYPLTDYKPRKAENLQRGYLQGRYGAIPFLGALADFSAG